MGSKVKAIGNNIGDTCELWKQHREQVVDHIRSLYKRKLFVLFHHNESLQTKPSAPIPLLGPIESP
jgi:hypothetical protein